MGMQKIEDVSNLSVVGDDIGKDVFHLVGFDSERNLVLRRKITPMTIWVRDMLEKKPARLVSVALANKLARTVWAILAHDRQYHPYHSALS